jgi:hypothetical protein
MTGRNRRNYADELFLEGVVASYFTPTTLLKMRSEKASETKNIEKEKLNRGNRGAQSYSLMRSMRYALRKPST